MKSLIKNILIFLLVFLVIAAIFSSYNFTRPKIKDADIGQLIAQLNNEEVQGVVIEENSLLITLKNGEQEKLQKEQGESFGEIIKNYNVAPEKISSLNIAVKSKSGWAYWSEALLPFLIPFIFIGVFIWFMMRQVQGANNRAMMFGQSGVRETPKNQKDKITFKDVAGVKEAKEDLDEIVEFLKTPKKFVALGAKIPKGALLMGAPGTGKTLLARAVAGEANVPFFHISGSEFVEMFVGVGASRVRDLFTKAKKNAPCIVFIDEIDAVGRQRGAGLGGSHDEREQTLNQILVEMDGFDPNLGIIVLAATNRPDILDPALLRPGRFDRRIVLDLPDINDREAILKIHAKNKPLAAGVTLRKLAERTPGFSGADLANLVNEAAIAAARQNKKIIDEINLLDSIEKVLLGPERKSHLLSDKEKEITAYHEAGHALVAHLLPHTDPVHKISIISRGRAAGYTLKLPEKDRSLKSRQEFVEELAVLLGGQIAEKHFFGDVTTGASNDLREATKIAKKIVTEYGMSEKLGLRTFGEKEELIFLGKEIHEGKDYSEKTAEKIDEEINMFIKNAKETAQKIIGGNEKQMKNIVEKLMKEETIEREAFEKIVGPKPKK
ncbi:MAG: ATP-dependent zinc metalloprotease FtsH [Patescibacteria group bacterium]|nr:ATP-dependent zinc metalloprotease FtsH [Patescibacteria group bacterium]MDD5490862.1 ATP-dependent zinc metalloprotease FtsH [Patescibacteria group bacterium]